MSESKKKEAEASKNHQDPPSLLQLILNHPRDKYRLVSVIFRWAQELRQKDQSPVPLQGYLDKAMQDVLGGKVKSEEIDKLPPAEKFDERKTAEAPRPAGDEKEKKEIKKA